MHSTARHRSAVMINLGHNAHASYFIFIIHGLFSGKNGGGGATDFNRLFFCERGSKKLARERG